MKPLRIRYVILLLVLSMTVVAITSRWWYKYTKSIEAPSIQVGTTASDVTFDDDPEFLKSPSYKNAVDAYINKDYALAVAELEAEIIKNPGHAQAYYLAGRIFEDVNFPDGKYFSKMAANYEKYLEQKPNGVKAAHCKLKLAQYYVKLGLTQQNAELLNKAEKYLTSLDPDNNDVRMTLGAIYLDQRNYSKAIAEFEKSANLQPNELRLKYNSLGLAYIKIGSLDKAEKVLNIAIQIKPDDKFAHNNLGFTYLRLKKYKEAQYQFNEAIKLDPKYENAQSNLEWVNTLIGM